MNSCNIIELGGRINGNFTRNYFININDLYSMLGQIKKGK